ncbi:MAG: HNH endonuclease signature motif containing protein [Candidatus Gastranaerophilales bacterium]|nr:HNH endonuclease signature motif containing protein [Candidatus Gastranaerophilales bacterium]
MFNAKTWSEETKQKVWAKAQIVGTNDPKVWRKDMAGAWIKYEDYGKTTSKTGNGWEIDHKKPEAKGGSDNLDNLQPLQWKNNRTKNDDYLGFKTSISSDGTKNIYKEQSWRFN